MSNRERHCTECGSDEDMTSGLLCRWCEASRQAALEEAAEQREPTEDGEEPSAAEIEHRYGPGSVQWGSWGDPRGR